ncbi:SX2_G0031450.mRNA.1.CDS.1 [Saccharomyces cerevisiae]|nr:SX2_G0031450.mRNA.1.CDS.1 [Saccharomyces cerevisiae]
MMIIIFIELCRIADSLLWIPKSSRRTSTFINNGIPTIISKFTHFSVELLTLGNIWVSIAR